MKADNLIYISDVLISGLELPDVPVDIKALIRAISYVDFILGRVRSMKAKPHSVSWVVHSLKCN